MLNKQILIGRVGQDPQVSGEGERLFARFSVATTETWTDNGERKERTTWHRCVCGGKLAQIVQRYVTKGQILYVEGPTMHRTYTGEDGSERESVEVRVSEMKMIGSPRREEDASNGGTQSSGTQFRQQAGDPQGQVPEATQRARQNVRQTLSDAGAKADDLPF